MTEGVIPQPPILTHRRGRPCGFRTPCVKGSPVSVGIWGFCVFLLVKVYFLAFVSVKEKDILAVYPPAKLLKYCRTNKISGGV